MLKKILVKELVDEGQRLLEALARNRFNVKAALWHYFPEATEWRLVIVSPAVGRGPLAAYTRVQSVLASTKPSYLTLTDIALMSPQSPEFRELLGEVAMGGQLGVGPATGPTSRVVFEDDYVYR